MICTYHYSCTSCHHFLQYNINYRRVKQHRSYYGAMSSMVPMSIVLHVDQISQPTPDNCLSQIHQAHKYNYQQQPIDNIVVSYPYSDNLTKLQSMYHNVRNLINNSPHHNHRPHKLNHQTNKFPSMNVSFPLVLCIPIHFYSGNIVRRLRDL